MVLAMLVFAVGNLLCGAATGLVALAFGRFVEGFGKMLAMAICRVTLYKQFDRRCWWPLASTASLPTRPGTSRRL